MAPKTPTVMHLSVAYIPWTVGGREIYTDRLSRGLRDIGWDSHVVFHQDLEDHPEPLGRTEQGGTPVTVLPPIEGQLDRERIYRRLPAAVPGFSALLDEVRPDIVHFQDFSIGANLLHMREAHAAGIPTVVTFHSPGQSCLQTALLYRGSVFCDGRIDVHRCTECRLNVAGVPFPVAHALASPLIERIAAKIPFGSPSLARASTSRGMTELFKDAWQEMIAGMDRLFVHARWQEEILLLNGVDPGKIETIWNGVDTPSVQKRVPDPSGPLNLAFVGRCEEVKGPGVLIDAVQRLPEEIDVKVHLFGLYWDNDYGQKLLTKIEGDKRFVGPRALAPAEVIPTLATMDLCVVPPLWVEVDPQIVLESFAAGTPVIGSSGYGVSERVADDVDGMLFPPGDDAELSRLIASLANDRSRVARLTEGVRPPKTIVEMAGEVAASYRRVVA